MLSKANTMPKSLPRLFQYKSVGISQHGEGLLMHGQLGHIQFCHGYFFPLWSAKGKRFSQRIEHDRATAVFVGRIFPHPINAHDKTLILNGAGAQQGFPGREANSGPIGHIKKSVVIAPIPTPNRETQIVAHLQQETNTPKTYHHSPFSAGVTPIFATIGKEMPFVIVMHSPVGLYKIKTVIMLFALLYSHRSGNSGIPSSGRCPHPMQRFSVFGLRQGLACNGKPRREHFGENV